MSSGPNAEGGPLPPVDQALVAEHEQRLADWVREIRWERNPGIRVLSITPDEHGGWTVDVEVEDVEDQSRPPADPSLVQFFASNEAGESVTLDLPIEVLHRIRDRIGEL